jgi:hypothetical protein
MSRKQQYYDISEEELLIRICFTSTTQMAAHSLLMIITKLTLWSWALENPRVVRPLDNFPAFYGIRRFNIEFTRALRLFPPWAWAIQSTLPHPTSTRSILIFSTHLRLGLPSGLFPSGFPTNNLYAFLFSPLRATVNCEIIHIKGIGCDNIKHNWQNK